MSTGPARPVPATRAAWLASEVREWERSGLLAPAQAEAVLARYRPVARPTLVQLALLLGGLLLGAGLVWLAVVNIRQLTPGARTGLLAAVWLAALASGELRARSRGDGAVVAALRLLAAGAFGATVLQAAWASGVADGRPVLLALWSAGVLLHAYAASSRLLLLPGVVLGTAWFWWQAVDAEDSVFVGVTALGACAVALVAVGVVHTRGAAARRPFATVWRETGTVAGLLALFAAALPFEDESVAWPAPLAVGAAAAVAVAVLATLAARDDPVGRSEPAGMLGAMLLAGWLAAWSVDPTGPVGADDWTRLTVAVVGFGLVTAGVAGLGVRRGSSRLTVLAALSFVLFTTAQSAAVVDRLVDGGWLFVVVGAVLLGSGLLARRTLGAAPG